MEVSKLKAECWIVTLKQAHEVDNARCEFQTVS